MKKHLISKMAVLSAILMASTAAFADPTLIISDGVTSTGPITVTNGNDTYLTASFDSSWSVVVTTAESKPVLGSTQNPNMALSIAATSLGSAHNLQIILSDTNFGPTTGLLEASFDGHPFAGVGDAISYDTYYDAGNGLAALTTPLTADDGFVPNARNEYLSDKTSVVTLSAPYSLSQVVTIDGGQAATYSLSANLQGTNQPPPPCICTLKFTSPSLTTNCAGEAIADITATQDCGSGPTPFTDISLVSSVTSGSCPQVVIRTVAATNACGMGSTFVQTNVINCLPDCNIALSVTTAMVGTSNLTASVADAGPGATYSWTIGNGTITAGSNTTTVTFTAGTNILDPVSLFVVVTSGAGCTADCNNSITLTPPPPPPVCSCASGSIGGISLGTTTNGLVVGLLNTKINNSLVTINGNEYVSKGGSLVNMAPSIVNGNVYEYASGQYSGPGKLNGSLVINPTLLNQVDADALAASAAAAALAPTVTFGTIANPTTVTGNGGLNVIKINGDIKNSLILNGTPSDVFIVNVTGTLSLGGSAVLGVSGGVASGNVLYNFIGASGTIATHVGNVMNGTLLAPHYSFNLDGVFNSRIIGGGASIQLLSGAVVNQPVCNCP